MSDDEKLEKVLEKLSQIEREITLIKEYLNPIKEGCEKMNSHIEFIEGVYKKVRTPLDYACEKLNYITNKTELKEK